MLANVFSIIKNAFQACFFWWDSIVSATGTFELLIGVFTISVMTRLLIIPIIGGQAFGGAASDSVRKFRARVKVRNQYRNEKIDSGNPKLGDGK